MVFVCETFAQTTGDTLIVKGNMYIRHIVKPTETYDTISKKYKVSVEELILHNKNSRLYYRQSLLIPIKSTLAERLLFKDKKSNQSFFSNAKKGRGLKNFSKRDSLNIAVLLPFYSSKNDSLRLYNTIGYLYYNMEDYQTAVENFEKAILYFTDEDKLEYTSILYYLGSAYYYLREYDDSITSYTKCLQYAKDQQDWIYAINNKLALTYVTIGKLEDSKRYYSVSNELYDVVDNKQFWTLYKINQKYGDNDMAVAYLDSSYTRLLNHATGYTNEHDRQNYLQKDKWNKCLQEECKRVK